MPLIAVGLNVKERTIFDLILCADKALDLDRDFPCFFLRAKQSFGAQINLQLGEFVDFPDATAMRRGESRW